MLSLVIDIQSDAVEGTLVNFTSPTAEPEMLYSTVAHISKKNQSNGDYLTKMMLKSVEDLCFHIVKEGAKVTREPIQSIHYILSSPWVISQSKTVALDYERETEVNESTIKGIIDADRKELVKKYESDMIFIEQKIFSVELNGYAVENYKGKRVKSLRVSFAFTLSSDKLIQKIHTAVSKSLHIKKEYYHSAILLQYLSSRAFTAESADFTVLHVHGELTDVVIVKKGFSAYMASFPFGISTLIRKVGLALHNSFEGTCSTLALYTDNKLDPEQVKKVENVLLPIAQGWRAECRQSLEGIGKDIALPHNVHLYSEPTLSSLFKSTLEGDGFRVVIHEGSLREKHIGALRDVI